ncbi:OmpP1/FadL family transporter [Thiomicrospira microaerophila]|uniref:OmpP1/FadL family transporter n=1 Tax=Thiomicrospira microaerophila TaxID=406020 RepID=UPI0005C926A8|nr:outer membrane protein transport protein [Thiomicrospira microaerophila]
MKKTKLALAIASAAMLSQPVLATNGTNMIGLGAQSSAMGGTGVAAYYGAENVVINPGLIGKAQGTEFSFGGTLFMPTVKNNSGMGESKSKADTNLIPSVSLVSRISDELTFGIGMYGSSGMGVDYSGSAAHLHAQTNMQIMRFVPSLAFNQDNFGIGFSPIIQYGSLDINYTMGDPTAACPGPNCGPGNVGHGMAADLGYGFSLGGYFDINENLTLAAAYTSAIKMKYDGQLSKASQPFVGMGMLPATFGDELEQPAELKIGLAFNMGTMTYTADYKNIAWGSATGYKDFNWQDQNVIAVGAKYTSNTYWAGLGVNHGNNPIKEMSATAPGGQATNMFNNLFFPATTETHITFGGGYNLTKNLSLDGAIVYAPEVKTTVKGPDFVGGNPMGADNTTTHSQMGYTISARYNF